MAGRIFNVTSADAEALRLAANLVADRREFAAAERLDRMARSALASLDNETISRNRTYYVKERYKTWRDIPSTLADNMLYQHSGRV